MMTIEELIASARRAADAAKDERAEAVLHAGEDFPVTRADKAASTVLENDLAKTGLDVVSEENDTIVPREGDVWLIDPIDGTTDFSRGSKDWCVMVARLQDGEPMQAVVYAPDRETIWYAERGAGAFRIQNGATERVTVSGRTDTPRMLMSATHPSETVERVRAAFAAEPLVVGSMGIKLSTIAEGGAECLWSDAAYGEWDVAAGMLILEEAGGRVTDIDGTPLALGNESRKLPRGLLGSNGSVHDALVKTGKTAS